MNRAGSRRTSNRAASGRRPTAAATSCSTIGSVTTTIDPTGRRWRRPPCAAPSSTRCGVRPSSTASLALPGSPSAPLTTDRRPARPQGADLVRQREAGSAAAGQTRPRRGGPAGRPGRAVGRSPWRCRWASMPSPDRRRPRRAAAGPRRSSRPGSGAGRTPAGAVRRRWPVARTVAVIAAAPTGVIADRQPARAGLSPPGRAVARAGPSVRGRSAGPCTPAATTSAPPSRTARAHQVPLSEPACRKCHADAAQAT